MKCTVVRFLQDIYNAIKVSLKTTVLFVDFWILFRRLQHLILKVKSVQSTIWNINPQWFWLFWFYCLFFNQTITSVSIHNDLLTLLAKFFQCYSLELSVSLFLIRQVWLSSKHSSTSDSSCDPKDLCLFLSKSW